MNIRNLATSTGMLSLMALTAFAQPTIVNKPAAYTSPTSGKEMYTEYCAVCHGPSGKGDGPALAALKKAPADLTQLAAKNGGKFPQAEITHYIEGADTVAAHGTREMPIWGKIFDSMNQDKEVKQIRVLNLANYLKTLQK